MGLYTGIIEESGLIDDQDFDYDALDEACVIAYLSRQPDEVIQEFAQSEECQVLINEGKISKKTIIKLNKNNDLIRRQTLAAYQIAKQKNDPNWAKFIKYKALANKYKQEIIRKYGNRTVAIAKKSQRDFVTAKPGNKEASVKIQLNKRREGELVAARSGVA